MSLLSPSVVAAITDLELAARIVVEGLRVGVNRSPFHGYGAEFQQYRPYRAGDDLKYLDWKMYARSDRLFTRQFRDTTNLSMMIILDSSASMAYPQAGVTKLRYSQILAASLAYLLVEQGNAVGLMSRADAQMTYLPARAGKAHLRALLARLERIRAEGTWSGADLVQRGSELLQRRGLVLVISDFYDDEYEMRRELRHVVRRGHDVTMLQVLAREELAPRLNGQVALEDMESREHRLVDGRAMSDDYSAQMQEFLGRWEHSATADRIDYALMPTDIAPEIALRDHLVRRKG